MGELLIDNFLDILNVRRAAVLPLPKGTLLHRHLNLERLAL